MLNEKYVFLEKMYYFLDEINVNFFILNVFKYIFMVINNRKNFYINILNIYDLILLYVSM